MFATWEDKMASTILNYERRAGLHAFPQFHKLGPAIKFMKVLIING